MVEKETYLTPEICGGEVYSQMGHIPKDLHGVVERINQAGCGWDRIDEQLEQGPFKIARRQRLHEAYNGWGPHLSGSARHTPVRAAR